MQCYFLHISFLFSIRVQNGRKAKQTTPNINTFGPRTAKEHIVQLWFRKVFKEDKSLEDKHSGWPSEVDNDQLKGSLKPILLQLHKELPKNSTSTILWSSGIWSKLERWKSLMSGWLTSWPQIKKKKNHCFEVLFLFYCMQQQQQTISWSDCNM